MKNQRREIASPGCEISGVFPVPGAEGFLEKVDFLQDYAVRRLLNGLLFCSENS